MSTAAQAESADAAPRGCVACIGVFDGVHRGHQVLVSYARARADLRGLPLVVVTFDPHPMAVVRPGHEPTLLATLAHRAELLLNAGADEVDVLEFDTTLAATEPEAFVSDLLVGRLGVREVVIGENFRFGHRARGTTETLRAEGERLGFEVSVLPLAGSGDQRWSSTRTRRLVSAGDVAAAAEALGRPYRLDGVVVHGDHRGRELGFPTANMQWSGTPTIPADGVYAGWVLTGAQRYPAAISVGTNPQFDGRERRVEAYVLDRDDLDLYGQDFSVEFTDRIRGQQTFTDVGALVAQMSEDVAAARILLGIRA